LFLSTILENSPMSLHLDPAASGLDFSRRLGPAPSFNEATARVEEALNGLRAAEASLERQLSDLRRYLRDEAIETDRPTIIDMAA
jgi:hypothetical protein